LNCLSMWVLPSEVRSSCFPSMMTASSSTWTCSSEGLEHSYTGVKSAVPCVNTGQEQSCMKDSAKFVSLQWRATKRTKICSCDNLQSEFPEDRVCIIFYFLRFVWSRRDAESSEFLLLPPACSACKDVLSKTELQVEIRS
jgi:hypothetical protein